MQIPLEYRSDSQIYQNPIPRSFPNYRSSGNLKRAPECEGWVFPSRYRRGGGGPVVHHAPCQPQRMVAVNNENGQAHTVRTIALNVIPFYDLFTSQREREREREGERVTDECAMNSRLVTYIWQYWINIAGIEYFISAPAA
ncbi:Uncharacterized protein DBV15_03693 [Temnothorax longispinosus]|uniref:Uncharacterized protein n=1 Tax=Temnothorax longispinosus TaxID=300112 RepID=A0A4S2KEU2_9HYME|nr:Uncharacterized protein DBV15_03693 [Temnothorax longispinosus]